MNESGESVDYIDNEQILENVSGVDHDLDTRFVVKKTWFNIILYDVFILYES